MYEKLLAAINEVGGIALSPTVSLCHQCHHHIEAYRYELDGKVFICKRCLFHGISHHQIENDVEFYKSLVSNKSTIWNFDNHILTEVTDRCNLECPHCYHLPDNKIKDTPIDELIERFRNYPSSIEHIILAGAESSLRKDLKEIILEINKLGKMPHILTNGVRFADVDFVKSLASTNVDMTIHIGLNHPSYIDNNTIRQKQLDGIQNIHNHLPNAGISYIGYTMVDLSELESILDEINSANFPAYSYRIRSGSDIGRNATQGHIFVSDVLQLAKRWADKNNISFNIIEADNNIYHVVVDVGGKHIRFIHWCDETNIDLEELRGGPWCDFVPDGITNFLHQVIRRDVWKNKNLVLPDHPPVRYQIDHQND